MTGVDCVGGETGHRWVTGPQLPGRRCPPRGQRWPCPSCGGQPQTSPGSPRPSQDAALTLDWPLGSGMFHWLAANLLDFRITMW